MTPRNALRSALAALILTAAGQGSQEGDDATRARRAQRLGEEMNTHLYAVLRSSGPEDRQDRARELWDTLAELCEVLAELDDPRSVDAGRLQRPLACALELLYDPSFAGFGTEELCDEFFPGLLDLGERCELVPVVHCAVADALLERRELSRAEDVLLEAEALTGLRLPYVPLLLSLSVLRGEWGRAFEVRDRTLALMESMGVEDWQVRGDPDFDVDIVQAALAQAELELSCGRASEAFRAIDRLRSQADRLGPELSHHVETSWVELLGARGAWEQVEASVRDLRERGEQELPRLLVARELLARAFLALQDGAGLEPTRRRLEAFLDGPSLDPLVEAQLRLFSASLATSDGDAEQSEVELRRAARLLDALQAREGLEATKQLRPFLALCSLRTARELGRGELAEAEARVLQAFELVLADWASTPLAPGGIGFLENWQRRGVVYEAISIHLERDGVRAALRALMRAQNLGSLARRAGLELPSVEEVLASVDTERQALVCYLPDVQQGIHCFTLAHGEVQHHALPTLRQAHERNSTEGTAVLSQLVPAEILDGFEQLSFVGLDLLRGNLFFQLPLEDGTPLCAARAVAAVPSLPLLTLLHRHGDASGTRRPSLALAVGPQELQDGSSFSIDLEALEAPFADARRLALADLLDDGAISEQAQARILHVLAHGTRDLERDRSAGLILEAPREGEPPQAIWADQLQRGPLPELVILASCHSGEGPGRAGEDGASHLGGACLQGGARCVLLGEGTLDAQWAGRMLAVFHAELAAGHHPAESLRRAYLEVGVHPDCSLHLFGLADRPLFDAPSWIERHGLRVAGALACLVGVLLLLRRRRPQA